MLSDEMKEKAVEVIARILSESAFIFVDPLGEGEQPDPVSWEAEGVSLDFSGYKCGTLSLYAGREFLRIAAANMLGIDDNGGYTPEKGADALKEILNIIVGNLLTTVYGTEPVFDLGIPRNISPDGLKENYARENAIWLRAEGDSLLFLIGI